MKTAMPKPTQPYIALYGSHGSRWRDKLAAVLESKQIPFCDPTDIRWQQISEQNGDEKQDLIDELVDTQHQTLTDAKVAIVYLHADSPSYAARAELAFLMGWRPQIPTFFVVDGQCTGRNYIWAAARRYDHMVKCNSLEHALDKAIKSFRLVPNQG